MNLFDIIDDEVKMTIQSFNTIFGKNVFGGDGKTNGSKHSECGLQKPTG